ncbi:MAG: SLC13 family permease [Gammaproteobacteria bacterium]|nr:MAG: SLC13 family permease [Gammaproteobacteria bacterium]
MSAAAWLVVADIIVCFALLLAARWPADLILFSGVTVLLVFGVVTPEQALVGMSNEGLATVAVLFVVARALSMSGVVAWISQRVLARPRSLFTAQLRLMLPVAAMSSVVNNTPVVAMMVPAVSDWAKRTGISVSQLFMPLSYAAIIGGTCTLVGTSTNLVINGMLLETGDGAGLSMFELAWLGIPCTLAVVAYTLFFSKRLLPFRAGALERRRDVRRYALEMRVIGSPLAGCSIEEAGLRSLPGVYLAEIQRQGRIIPAVSSKVVLHEDDRLVFFGDVGAVVDLKNIHGLQVAEDQVFKVDASRDDRCLVEVVISPSFPGLNQSVKEVQFRSRYSAAIISIARDGEFLKGRIGDIILRPGDTLLVETHSDFVPQQRYSKDFLLVSRIENSREIQHHRRGVAGGILLAMVAVVAFGWLSMFQASVLAALAMLATGCLSLQEARDSIDWQVVVIIGASIGLGGALQSSGAASAIASSLLGLVASSPMMVLAMVFALTALFSAMVSNVAAAVIMFPIIMEISQSLGVSLEPFAVTLMMAASTCFATPIGYQTNLMVYGPGDYRFRDFLVMGTPLTILVGILTVIIVPLVWPFA